MSSSWFPVCNVLSVCNKCTNNAAIPADIINLGMIIWRTLDYLLSTLQRTCN